MEVNASGKHTSLLRYGNNYSFIVQAPGLKFSVQMLMLNKKILKIGVIYKEVEVKKTGYRYPECIRHISRGRVKQRIHSP